MHLRASLAPLLAVLALPLLAGCGKSTEAAPDAASAPPPPTVSVVTVAPQSVPVSTEWVATLDGYVNAQIRPQVSGYLIRRAYTEGTFVRKGQVLFEIDARPLAAALAQAQAALAEAQAQLGRTERDVQRNTPLAKERAIPQSQLDNDIQANLAAQAAVKAAQAAVDTAELNLGFTKVRSLIDGIAAIATAQIGDLVGPTTLLTTVSQVDPIRANFSISEQEYLEVADRINQAGSTNTLWKEGGGLRLTLANGEEHAERGRVLAADREVDPRTGTIRITATFPNPKNILRPGQYGRVRAETKVLTDALLVPQRAVTELQGAMQLRVVGDDNKVKVETVTLGSRVGNQWVVESGLSPNARVIVDATQIRDGTAVQAKPYAPAAGESVTAGAVQPGGAQSGTQGSAPAGVAPAASSPAPQTGRH